MLHEILSRYRARFLTTLHDFKSIVPELRGIPLTSPADPRAPRWVNDFFPPLDALALSHTLLARNPSTLVEIGSGESTKFARRAIVQGNLRTRIVSIDPSPRAEIDALCDEVIRQPLETADLALFRQLGEDDVVFFDGSHRVFTNSDTTVLFLDVLPVLARGALVHFHDIYLPLDYPPEWASRFYAEQYLLAAALMTRDPGFAVLLANAFISTDVELREILQPVWTELGVPQQLRHGQSFWIQREATTAPAG